MEALHVLEQKIVQLIALVKDLKEQNSELQARNALLEGQSQELSKKVESLEVSMLSNKENFKEEAELARLAVDELIKNIDSLVEHE